MLVRSWRKERSQDWNQEYQVSGTEAGRGGSQQETPKTCCCAADVVEEAGLLLPSPSVAAVVGSDEVSFAT